MSKEKIKVLIAMSGGVDSSVAAALLLKAGYQVTGAFMKQWSDKGNLVGQCTWKKDKRDALRVAAHLSIPLLSFDFEKEYQEFVLTYMFREYRAGRTPNPDVMCNKYIKFGLWLDRARALGFDYLATGHYADIETQKNGNNKTFHLIEAKDTNKDQTYFLHQLTQAQLKHVLFPIGNYTKPQVRRLAKNFNLPTAEREESMGICFVGEVPMQKFLLQKIKPTPGKIVTATGEVVGQHDGLPFYTIGQRHFLKSTVKNQLSKISNSKPLYVVDKNKKKNELIVGFEDDPVLYKEKILLSQMHWTSGQAPKFPLQCQVRLRHRQKMQNAKCSLKKGRMAVEFSQPQKAVTPGQFAVFYHKGECLGGGVIA